MLYIKEIIDLLFFLIINLIIWKKKLYGIYFKELSFSFCLYNIQKTEIKQNSFI